MNNNNEPNESVVGEHLLLSIDKLLLDESNPRFELGPNENTQLKIAIKLEMGYDVIKIGESIARNGFFANEPLIVITSNIPDKYIVIEGNRRLTALLALTKAEFREKMFQAKEWQKLSENSKFLSTSKIPVTLVTNRDFINPILGFRHISGILSWQPLAQAKFIARLIDEDGLDFEAAAEVVGKSKNDVANMYRNQSIARQASKIGFQTSGLETSFSLLTVAMGSPGIRSHVAAPLGSAIKKGEDPIPTSHHKNLKEVLAWIFGDDAKEPVIRESREINKLGKIIQNAVGLETLRRTSNLQLAEAAIQEKGMDPRTRLLNRLRAANESLKAAFDDISEFSGDPAVKDFIQNINENANNLTEIIDDCLFA